jgi:predicted metalloendopeptidase
MPLVPARLAAALAAALPAVCAATLDVAGLSKDISPCDDFYAYANRHWLEATAIPDDKPGWGTFAIIDQRNKERLKAILASAAASNPFPPGSNRHKVVAYYASGMDEAAIARAGLAPLAPLFAAIEAVKAPADLPQALAALHRSGVRAGFSFAVRQDAKDSRRYLAEIQAGGLGLPDRDYYFREDERSKSQREAYRAHVAEVFRLAGEEPAAAGRLADGVMAIETALAGSHLTLVERRDPDRVYNLRTVDRLAEEAPGFGWKAYFAAAGIPPLAELNNAQPAAATRFAKLAAAQPAADWRAYLRWHALNAAATKLPREFEQAHFAFFQRTLTGVREMPPRDERVIEAISGRYGGEPLAHALGELFVGEAFPPEAKRRAVALVGHVKAAFRERLEKLDWMEEATRRAALAKLDRMAVKIGYPDRWRDFAAAGVGDRPFAANWLAANAFEFGRVLSRLGRPVDRGEWWMSPHIVNAYFGSTLNEIVFPAGILQPPYFDPKADDAVNFGGIRHGDRPRDHARLRRPRPPLRRRRQPARMVDRRRPQALPGARAGDRRAVRRVRGRGRPQGERQAHAGREHRRRGRPADLLPGAAARPGRKAAGADPGLHARAALLPVVRADLALAPAARAGAAAPAHRQPLAAALPRAGAARLLPRVRPRVLLPGGREGPSRRGRAREPVVRRPPR